MTPQPGSSFYRRILLSNLVVPVSVVVTSALLYSVLIFHLLSLSQWVDRTDQIIARGNNVLKLMVDTETGVRGFLISGKEIFLDRYSKAIESVGEKVEDLKTRLSDEPEQVRNIENIYGRYQNWLDYSRKVIALKRENKDYRGFVAEEQGKSIMDEIREQFAGFVEAEQKLRDERVELRTRATRMSLEFVILAAVLTILVMIFFGRRQLHELAETYQDFISNRAKLTNLLNESQEIAHVGGWELDPGSQTLSWTDETFRLHDLSPAEFTPTVEKAVGFYTEESLPRIREALELAISTGRGFSLELQVITARGRRIDVQATGKALREDGKVTRVFGAFRDITERKRSMDDLRQAVQKLTTLLENAPVAVIEWSTTDFRISRWSSEAERVFGWTAAEAVGRRLDDMHMVYPGDRQIVDSVMDDMISGRRPRNVNKNRNYRKDGTVIECEWYNSTLTDESGKLQTVLSLVLDVTETRRLERELRAAVSVRDEFLSIASHELRTPLTALGLGIDLVQRRLDKIIRTSTGLSPGTIEALGTVRGSVESSFAQTKRLTNLLGELLDVTRIRAGKLTINRAEMDLSEAARESVAAITTEAQQSGVVISVHAAAPVRGVWDLSRIQQVLINLLSNAIKYGGGTPIDVAVSTDTVRGVALLAVSDSGPGMTPEVQTRIFERFERATGDRKISGLGLGLYIVKQIVLAHGGDIRVESAPGKGARFIVELPLKAESAKA